MRYCSYVSNQQSYSQKDLVASVIIAGTLANEYSGIRCFQANFRSREEIWYLIDGGPFHDLFVKPEEGMTIIVKNAELLKFDTNLGGARFACEDVTSFSMDSIACEEAKIGASSKLVEKSGFEIYPSSEEQGLSLPKFSKVLKKRNQMCEDAYVTGDSALEHMRRALMQTLLEYTAFAYKIQFMDAAILNSFGVRDVQSFQAEDYYEGSNDMKMEFLSRLANECSGRSVPSHIASASDGRKSSKSICAKPMKRQTEDRYAGSSNIKVESESLTCNSDPECAAIGFSGINISQQIDPSPTKSRLKHLNSNQKSFVKRVSRWAKSRFSRFFQSVLTDYSAHGYQDIISRNLGQTLL